MSVFIYLSFWFLAHEKEKTTVLPRAAIRFFVFVVFQNTAHHCFSNHSIRFHIHTHHHLVKNNFFAFSRLPDSHKIGLNVIFQSNGTLWGTFRLHPERCFAGGDLRCRHGNVLLLGWRWGAIDAIIKTRRRALLRRATAQLTAGGFSTVIGFVNTIPGRPPTVKHRYQKAKKHEKVIFLVSSRRSG